jgi:hypothetical protein
MIVHFVGYGQCACTMPMPPAKWPEGHRWSSNWEEVNCPECLKGKEPIDTFIIHPAEGNNPESIECKRCGMRSYNHNDVEQHYCGFCHVYHDDLWPPARHWWIQSLKSKPK